MRFTRALVRRPGPELVAGLRLADLGAVDATRASEQHSAYVAALRAAGIAVTELPPEPAHPDACFVEDTAILTPSAALLTRPGHPSRAGEVASIAPVLERWFADCSVLAGHGHLDGGDVLEADGHFLIGLSARTDADGAAALGAWLGARGYTSATLDLTAIPGLLHLKTGITWLGAGRVLVWPELAGHRALARWQCLVVADEERYAANGVLLGDRVVLPDGFPRTRAAVEALGLGVVPLAMSEFQKVDGGLSCLSLRV